MDHPLSRGHSGILDKHGSQLSRHRLLDTETNDLGLDSLGFRGVISGRTAVTSGQTVVGSRTEMVSPGKLDVGSKEEIGMFGLGVPGLLAMSAIPIRGAVTGQRQYPVAPRHHQEVCQGNRCRHSNSLTRDHGQRRHRRHRDTSFRNPGLDWSGFEGTMSGKTAGTNGSTVTGNDRKPQNAGWTVAGTFATGTTMSGPPAPGSKDRAGCGHPSTALTLRFRRSRTQVRSLAGSRVAL